MSLTKHSNILVISVFLKLRFPPLAFMTQILELNSSADQYCLETKRSERSHSSLSFDRCSVGIISEVSELSMSYSNGASFSAALDAASPLLWLLLLLSVPTTRGLSALCLTATAFRPASSRLLWDRPHFLGRGRWPL